MDFIDLVIKIGNKVLAFNKGSLGSMKFVADGRFDYDKIIKLNKKTGYRCRFGESNGYNVAIIGITIEDYNFTSFQLPWEFGKLRDDTDLLFTNYSEEKAKSITDYVLMGFCDPMLFIDTLKFISIEQSYDSRYQTIGPYDPIVPKILSMNYKWSGTYSFDSIEELLKTDDFIMTSDCTYGIQNGLPTAIIGYWQGKENYIKGFKDVWEFGEEEPKTVDFTPLSIEEAKEINNFVVYGYDYTLPTKQTAKYPIEKVNRTFHPDFDFYQNGIDYRLTPISNEIEENKSLKLQLDDTKKE